MPRTKKQFEEIRNEKSDLIKDVAISLFANVGYYSTSIASIAKQANISKGLLYNYFDSKEDLLKCIFSDIVDEVMTQINPKQEDKIEDNQAEHFVDIMFDVVIENPQDWKLFFQLATQQDVMDVLMHENLMDKMLVNQKFLFNYFVDHEFDDVRVSILHFSSVYKGFAMSYVFAPELFDKETITQFKNILKEFFVKPKRNEPRKDIVLDEFMGYLLM